MDSIYQYSTLKTLTDEVSDTETLGPGFGCSLHPPPPSVFVVWQHKLVLGKCHCGVLLHGCCKWFES